VKRDHTYVKIASVRDLKCKELCASRLMRSYLVYLQISLSCIGSFFCFWCIDI